MYCWNCGAQNPDTAKFCAKCGTQLVKPDADRFPEPKPAVTFSSPATVGGLVAMIGGVITIFGWLLPWSVLGVGNGLQIMLLALTASVAALEDEGFIALLGFILVVILVAIPVLGAMCIMAGVRVFEKRNQEGAGHRAILRTNLQEIRTRGAWILGLMLLLYVLISAIPFISAAIGRGFYLTAVGGVTIFLGALVAASMITETGPDPRRGMRSHTSRTYDPPSGQSEKRSGLRPGESVQLSAQEKEVLRLLAQGLSNVQIATEMGVSPIASATMADDMRERFRVLTNDEMVKIARERGLLPPAG